MSLTGSATISKKTLTCTEIQKAKIEVTVINTQTYPIQICQYLSYLNYVKEILFNGKALPKMDTGECMKMREPNDEDYFKIEPGKSLNFYIPITKANFEGSEYYDLSEVGSYVAILNDKVEGKINGKEIDYQFNVNSVQFDIQ